MVSNRVHDPFSLIIIVAGLTWIIPAGQYDRAMNEEVGREVAVPGTYQTVDPNPQGFVEVMLAPVAGFYDPDSYAANAIDVALFVLLLGGFLGVVNATKAIDTGIQTAMGRMKGREIWMIVRCGYSWDIPFVDYSFSLSAS